MQNLDSYYSVAIRMPTNIDEHETKRALYLAKKMELETKPLSKCLLEFFYTQPSHTIWQYASRNYKTERYREKIILTSKAISNSIKRGVELCCWARYVIGAMREANIVTQEAYSDSPTLGVVLDLVAPSINKINLQIGYLKWLETTEQRPYDSLEPFSVQHDDGDCVSVPSLNERNPQLWLIYPDAADFHVGLFLLMTVHEASVSDTRELYPLSTKSSKLVSSADVLLCGFSACLFHIKTVYIVEGFDVDRLPFSSTLPGNCQPVDIPISAEFPLPPISLANSPLFVTCIARKYFLNSFRLSTSLCTTNAK